MLLWLTVCVCVCVEGVSSRAYVELPVYSKYLVIAAYIASYNPVKSDKRFFSKVVIEQNTVAMLSCKMTFGEIF